MTKDNLRLILEEDTEDFKFPTDESFSGGRSDNYSGFQNKTWTADELKFNINDPTLVGTEIEFVYSPVAYTWDFPFEKFTKNETTGKYEFKFGGFIGKNDIKFFDMYIDGEYIDPTSYVTLPTSASTDARITISIPDPSTLTQWYENTNHVIQLRYNPTDYHKKSGSALNLLSKYHPWFDTTKTYDTTKSIFNYSIFTTNLYNKIDSYLNSDCSRLFIKRNTDTSIMLPYKWNVNKTVIDLQDTRHRD